MYGLRPGETAFFVDADFFIRWRHFLLGNLRPPGPINNRMLLLNDRFTGPEGDEIRLLSPNAQVYVHFWIVSEVRESAFFVFLFHKLGMVLNHRHETKRHTGTPSKPSTGADRR